MRLSSTKVVKLCSILFLCILLFQIRYSPSWKETKSLYWIFLVIYSWNFSFTPSYYFSFRSDNFYPLWKLCPSNSIFWKPYGWFFKKTSQASKAFWVCNMNSIWNLHAFLLSTLWLIRFGQIKYYVLTYITSTRFFFNFSIEIKVCSQFKIFFNHHFIIISIKLGNWGSAAIRYEVSDLMKFTEWFIKTTENA